MGRKGNARDSNSLWGNWLLNQRHEVYGRLLRVRLKDRSPRSCFPGMQAETVDIKAGPTDALSKRWVFTLTVEQEESLLTLRFHSPVLD